MIMKKELLCFIIMLFGMIDLKAQNHKILKFEKELLEFRYTFYPEIKTVDDANRFFSSDAKALNIIEKAKKFYEINHEKIEKLQLYYLQKYEDTKIDMSEFTLDTIFQDVEVIEKLENRINELIDTKKLLGKELERIINYNPIFLAFNYRYWAMHSVSSDLYLRVVRHDNIAFPKIKCTKISEGQWQILIDQYWCCFDFKYIMKLNELIFHKFYRRKDM